MIIFSSEFVKHALQVPCKCGQDGPGPVPPGLELKWIKICIIFHTIFCLLLFCISFLVLFALIPSVRANTGFQNSQRFTFIPQWLKPNMDDWLSTSPLNAVWMMKNQAYGPKMPFKLQLACFYVSNPDWPSCELLMKMFVLPFLWSNILVTPLLGGPDLWQRLYIVLSKRPWEPTSLWMCLEEHICPVMSDSVNVLGGERERNKYKFWFSVLSAVVIASSSEITSGGAIDGCQETIVF